MEEGVEEGGFKIGWWQCFRAVRAVPGPGGLVTVALGPKRTRARKHCHQPIFEAKLANFKYQNPL